MALNIDFEDFSNGVIDYTNPAAPSWDGTGVFDKLMHAINGNILVQYDSGRIKGPEYAQVYLGSMQTAIVEAMKFMLTKDQIAKDLDLKQAQIEKLADDKLTAAKQRDLYQRQIVGFDDNKYQKLFESQLSSWGLMFSSGMLTEKPSIITGDKVSQLYTKLTQGM